MNERDESDRDGEDVDPEAVERAHDDFERALRGAPRALPRVKGVPKEMVRELVDEMFGEAYRAAAPPEEDGGVSRVFALTIWSEIEPVAIRRLREIGRHMDELEVTDAAKLLESYEQLQRWTEEVDKLLHQLEERAAVELELATREDGSIQVDQVRRGLSQWEPELPED